MLRDAVKGQIFEVAYPFIRTTYETFDEDGSHENPSWRPGCEYEGRGYGENIWSEAVADGIGKQVLTVVDTFKPGKYPERVFYTVKWIAPDGAVFGKNKLHIATAEKFRRLTRGYMFGHTEFDGYHLRGEDSDAA